MSEKESNRSKRRRHLARFEAKIARVKRLTDEQAYRSDIRAVLTALWKWIKVKHYAPSIGEIVRSKGYDRPALTAYLRDLRENQLAIMLPRTQKDAYRWLITETGSRVIRREHVTPLLPADYEQGRRLWLKLREEAADEVELERLRDAFGWVGRMRNPDAKERVYDS